MSPLPFFLYREWCNVVFDKQKKRSGAERTLFRQGMPPSDSAVLAALGVWSVRMQSKRPKVPFACLLCPLHIPRLLLRANETYRLYEEMGGAPPITRLLLLSVVVCRRCSQLFARYSNSGLQSMEVRSSCVGAIPLFSRDDVFSSHVLWLARIITLRQGILC